MEHRLFVLVLFSISSFVASIFILRINWRRYGIIYLLSSLVGIVFCFLFVSFGFYSFPITILPRLSIPIIEMATVLPFLVMFGIRYSPVKWAWKIPFYWALVHLIMLQETLFLSKPIHLIQYEFEWDFWDSYTWWWIFLLLFEWIGALLSQMRHENQFVPVFFVMGNGRGLFCISLSFSLFS